MKAVINISQLVTCAATRGLEPKRGRELKELDIIKDGCVLVENGVIRDVGTMYSLKDKLSSVAPEDIVDARNHVVIPGFVDSHTHALFAGTREKEFAMRVAGRTYMEILEEGGGILSSTKMLEQSSDEEILNQTRARLARMAAHGTTTVEIKSGYGLSTEQEIRSLELIKKLKGEGPLDIRSTFMGAHAVPVEYRSSRKDFINMITNEMIPIVGRKKLADFCDVFCEKGVFDVKETELIFQSAIEHGLRLRLHSDEIESIGGTELGCASGAMSVDHLIAIKEAGLKALEGSRTVANLLPGTSFSLMKSYAPAREMVDRGIAVSISTDCNPGSCYTESMPMVITLACVGLRLSPEEAINAATFNGACSLGMQEEVGSIEMGKQADLLVLHCGDYREIPYHFGVNPVKMTMKKGQWLSFDGK